MSAPTHRDPVLTAILLWTTLLTGILAWLPLVRGAVEGVEYQWVLADGIGGRGTGGDYPGLVLGALFAFVLLYLGRRGVPHPFHAMLLLLHLPLATAVTWAAVTQPESFRFEGASLGIDIPLAWIGPILFDGFALLCLWWVVADLRSRRARRRVPWTWTRAAWIRLGIVAALVPIQVALLRGELASLREALGVVVTVSQWFVINRAINAPRPVASPSS
jgi:hypothetical protein